MLRESTIQLVTVTGEPGVGKTRLLAEFRGWVDARPELVYWRQGRCLPYGDEITFWALGEIVKAHAGILESDAPRRPRRSCTPRSRRPPPGTANGGRARRAVHRLEAARLASIPSKRKALLQNASVMGKVFWAGALEAMAGRDAAEVREGLHQLALRELVRPARTSSVESQAEYESRTIPT